VQPDRMQKGNSNSQPHQQFFKKINKAPSVRVIVICSGHRRAFGGTLIKGVDCEPICTAHTLINLLKDILYV